MSNKKNNNSIGVIRIFFSGIKTYFLYLDDCVRYLTFPIFGQILSSAAIFALSYYFCVNEYSIRNLAPLLSSDKNYLTVLLIVLFPFLIVLTKAVFDYIIVFSALNIFFYTVSNKKKVKNIDFKSAKNVIKRRLFKYIVLMFLLTLILCIPPLIFVSPVAWIFLCLTFQIFSFESDISASEAVSRSIVLVKNNFVPTVIMLILCISTTYIFFPAVFVWSADKISLTSFIAGGIEKYINLIPVQYFNVVNDFLSGFFNISIDSIIISKYIAQSVISFVVIAYTLPFRCCCFTGMYRLYDNSAIKEYSKETDEIIKRSRRKS